MCARALLLFTLLLTHASRQAAAVGKRVKRSSSYQVPLTDNDKATIVLHHNDLRRLARSSNMRYMSWDSELEWLAASYSKLCTFQHNPNRKHSRGWSVGENIYSRQGDMTAADAIDAIQKWYDEVQYFNDIHRTCQLGKMCGHYTQVVWATTFKIGCALTTCNWIQNVAWNGRGSLFICNYATSGNVVKSDGRLLSVYEKGPACSRCDEYDYCRNHLCANNARDFLGSDGEGNSQDSQSQSQERCQCLQLLIAVISLCVVISALIAFILYRERVRIMVRIGLWRARRKPMQSSKFSNQNTPSASVINTPRHSVTALHGIHRIADSPSPTKCREMPLGSSVGSSKSYRADQLQRISPPTRLPPLIPSPLLKR